MATPPFFRDIFDVPDLADAPALSHGGHGGGPEERRGVSTRTIAGLAIAGVGVVSVGVGSYFGVAAIGKNHDANSNGSCGINGQPDGCNSLGVSLRSTALTDGTVSTVLIVAGAAAVVGGGVLWLTDPRSKAQATVGFDGRMLRLAGSF